MKNFSMTFGVIVSQLLLVPVHAFASRGDDFNIRSLQQQLRASTVSITGALTCKMGEINTGEACNLKITDSKTGKIFGLANAGDAMRMYNSGTKNVAIEGTVNDNGTISVAKISAL